MRLHPIQSRFRHPQREYSVCIDGPSLEVITSFACCGTNVWKMRRSGFGLRQAEVPTRDCRHVCCEAGCLVRVSVGRSDWRHETDSPFHAITKVPRILDASTVLMMSIHKCVKEAHHHDPMLQASQEHMGDQVMEKVVPPWKHSSLVPKRNMSYKRGLSRAHSEIQHDTFTHNPQCEIFEPCIARYKGCEENQQ